MSESEEEACFYGTPLEPYDEDSFPKKKPISLEEQVAKDAQGRRRFHGAFTGGFSAGFFNTVGSLEGWTPSEFRSSRSEKAINNVQVPEDFMDDEDLGEFGIAPQTVRATDDYSGSKKRKRQVHADGPIPGVPVLETLIQAGNETVGYFLMKNMNRRHHQANAGVKVYGCAMPSVSDDEPKDEYNVHEYYTRFLKSPKANTSGVGYISLDKTHLNLFQPAKLTVRERNNKKLSISGQAFGVGAFEDDDEDIYVKDDMTHYDFELTSETKSEKKKSGQLLFDLFVISTKTTLFNTKVVFAPPVIPSTFTGKHKVRKSRFEPAPEEPVGTTLNAAVRAKYLGESPIETIVSKEKPEEPARNKSEVLDNVLADRFVSATQKDDLANILEPVEKFQSDHGSEELREAVRMKMFGPLTRVTLPWQPCALLCKRFNVPQPHFEDLNAHKRKRTKHLIFEYQKHEEKEVKREPGLGIKPSSSIQAEDTTQPIENEPNKIDTEPPSEINEPKTVDITDRLDLAQKADLFKAVFLSSSESEASDNEDDKAKQKEVMTANVVSEPLLPKIKPIKEGILSNLSFPQIQPEKPKPPPTEDRNTYGPRLPDSLSKAAAMVINEPVVNLDEWVEKGEGTYKKKHKKKHKKEKGHKHRLKR